MNADLPADFDEDGARGASDHDPVVARFAFPEDGEGDEGEDG